MDEREMLEHVEQGVALEWHLQHNHFPPIPLMFVGPAESAIAACGADDPDRDIQLPEGVEFRRDGSDHAPAWALVEFMHLDGFIEWEDE